MTEDIHRIIKFDYMQELNLPKKITFPEGYIVNGYYYDGVKYSKTRFDNNSNLLEEEKFFGNLIIRNNRPFRILHDEGYVDLTDMGQVDQKYYHIKDHLGNVRVVIQDYNNSHLINQVSTYYPFGMVMQPERFVNSQEETDNQYLYNGKEQQEMPGGWYDYGARFYDAQIGRWHIVDPMAVERTWVNPYNYTQNNPLSRIDPDGELDTKYVDEDGKELLNTNDGSNTEVVVPKSEEKEFKRFAKYYENPGMKEKYDSPEQNNAWREKFGYSTIHVNENKAIEIYLNLTDEEGALNDFFRNPSSINYGIFVTKRIANQSTNPLNYTPGPSVLKAKKIDSKITELFNSALETIPSVPELLPELKTENDDE